SANRKPSGGPPTSEPRMLTRITSKKAAPIRSQKLAFGNAQASGRTATAAPPPMLAGASGGSPGFSAAADCGGGEAMVIAGSRGGVAAKLDVRAGALAPAGGGKIGGSGSG